MTKDSMPSKITPVILCGGSGTRLWPLSRKLYPKQFLNLQGSFSLLQQTVMRLADIETLDKPLIICNEEHRFLVAEQLRQIEITPQAIILEPFGRNTAPATALAALHTKENGHDLMLILPADHTIENCEVFSQAISAAIPVAQQGQLITFGIIANKPETGFGYIQKGARINENRVGAYKIASFVEKPDLETARAYISSGDYFWNSGMFLFPATLFLHELHKFNKTIHDQCLAAYDNTTEDLDFIRINEKSFRDCPNDSIDYAVMERTKIGAVIPVDIGWDDIGSWSSLWDLGDKDKDGNLIHGDVIQHDTENCLLHASSRLLATIGINDCVVVETSDAVLVAHKDRTQDIKRIVNTIVEQGRPEANLHRRVYRPWGSYEEVISGDRFQVKLITVKPKSILSLQMHHHRAEHWVVVKGTARITKGEEVFLLKENESTFIPQGETHRLENPGEIPLELIEVQSGSYLGEDDIVRFEDNYGRCKS